MLPIITTDNFFHNPYEWRQLALFIQDWHQDDKGMWPGKRSKHLSEVYPNKVFELKYMLEEILPNYIIRQTGGLSYLECRFQSISSKWGSGWIHEDKMEDIDFAGVVYLDEHPQDNSGTSIYEFLGESTDILFDKKYTNHKSEIYIDTDRHSEIEYIKEMRKPFFKESAKIENVFNRCTLYDARYWHAANKYYGETLEDSRLTLVFFGKFKGK